MTARMPGFTGEYLSELDVVRIQLLTLADAAPPEIYGWKPAENARSFAAVLVHVAASNFSLLRVARAPAAGALEFYGDLQGDRIAQFVAMLRQNQALERDLRDKAGVLNLLKRSFEAVTEAFRTASSEEIGEELSFFGEQTTVRRVYLRLLAHAHEHMGQAIAYVRMNGLAVPWPDPLPQLERTIAEAAALQPAGAA